MHLVVVTPFPPAVTGVGQYGYYITRTLAGTECFSRITVLAGSNSKGKTPNHLGPTEIDYCWEPGRASARRAILAGVKRLKPDLVWFNLGASAFGHSPWMNVSGWLTPLLVRQMGIPTVVTLHELVELSDLRALNAPGGPFAFWGARLLTSIATQADVTCLTMRHYVDWLMRRNVDCEHIPIGAYHEPKLLDESPSQELLFFTTLAPFKGLETLLEAFRRLQAEIPDLKLTIAGTEHNRFPHYASELKARFDGMAGLQWLGQISEEHVMNLFLRARLVVLPYTASTGSSSVLYQSATWGRAVVVSDLEEIQTLVRESGLRVQFFQRGNADDLIESIRRMLASADKRQAQTIHNFKIIQHIRPEVTGRKYIRAFNRALEKHQSLKRIPIPQIEADTR